MLWQMLAYFLSRALLFGLLAALGLVLVDAAAEWASLHGWLPR